MSQLENLQKTNEALRSTLKAQDNLLSQQRKMIESLQGEVADYKIQNYNLQQDNLHKTNLIVSLKANTQVSQSNYSMLEMLQTDQSKKAS